jgi:DNA-binding FadR family transcriptional regulator
VTPDRLFHKAVAVASCFVEHRRGAPSLWGRIKILESFRQHNPAKAHEAMRRHLQSFQQGYKVLFEALMAEKKTALRVVRNASQKSIKYNAVHLL